MGIISFFKRSHQKNIVSTEEMLSISEADFVIKKKVEGIGLKSSLMEYAAYKNSMEVERLSKNLLVVHTRTGQQFAFINMNGHRSSRIGMRLCDNKHFARSLLEKNGLNVVESEHFGPNDFHAAVRYAKTLGFPVVVKPINLARGRGVTTNIQSIGELKEAWKNGFEAFRRKRKFNRLLIERHVIGEDFRFFVVGNRLISVTHRKRANIVGDGKSTIYELIEIKNKKRLSNPYLSNYLIPTDYKKLDVIRKKNISMDDIPNRGEVVVLRSQSNLSAGGDSVDVTDEIHPDYKNIAIRAVQSILGIEYAGVDIITSDISVKPTRSNHIVSEVEFSPAPLAHFPYKGKRRDMAGAILDYYIQHGNL